MRILQRLRLVQKLAQIPWLGPRVVLRLHNYVGLLGVADWNALVQKVQVELPDVISLDVFDTCLVRSLAGDEAIEDLIRHRMQIQGGTYDAVAADAEHELCQPVPEALAALVAIRQRVPNVVFLSDTERSSALLIEILDKFGFFKPGDVLLASCELQATKAQGSLFKHHAYCQAWLEVARPGSATACSSRSGAELSKRVWHIGNHAWSDGAMAVRANLNALVVSVAEPNRYENVFLADSNSKGPSLAAAARAARFEIEADSSSGVITTKQAVARCVGASVAGLSLSAFVLWVIERCREYDLEQVAFLARDGELPMRMAQQMPADYLQGLTLHYLHCSRLTWSLAAASAVGVQDWIDKGSEDELAFLHNKRHDVPVDTLIGRLGLLREDFEQVLCSHREFSKVDFEKPLRPQDVFLWDQLLADSALVELVGIRSAERRELIMDYLEQIGFPDSRIALVDVGWRGRLAWQISAVLRDIVKEEPVHLHFGGDKVHADVDSEVMIRRFAFDGVSQPHPVRTPVSCVETLTASGKARAIGYVRNADGLVELEFEDAVSSQVEDRVELWEGALSMAQKLPAWGRLQEWGLTSKVMDNEVREMLGLWWNKPTRLEAEALAGLRFEHDEAGNTFRPLAVSYEMAELVGLSPAKPRQWPQGSESLSPLSLRVAIAFLRPIYELGARLFRS